MRGGQVVRLHDHAPVWQSDFETGFNHGTSTTTRKSSETTLILIRELHAATCQKSDGVVENERKNQR